MVKVDGQWRGRRQVPRRPKQPATGANTAAGQASARRQCGLDDGFVSSVRRLGTPDGDVWQVVREEPFGALRWWQRCELPVGGEPIVEADVRWRSGGGTEVLRASAPKVWWLLPLGCLAALVLAGARAVGNPRWVALGGRVFVLLGVGTLVLWAKELMPTINGLGENGPGGAVALAVGLGVILMAQVLMTLHLAWSVASLPERRSPWVVGIGLGLAWVASMDVTPTDGVLRSGLASTSLVALGLWNHGAVLVAWVGVALAATHLVRHDVARWALAATTLLLVGQQAGPWASLVAGACLWVVAKAPRAGIVMAGVVNGWPAVQMAWRSPIEGAYEAALSWGVACALLTWFLVRLGDSRR